MWPGPNVKSNPDQASGMGIVGTGVQKYGALQNERQFHPSIHLYLFHLMQCGSSLCGTMAHNDDGGNCWRGCFSFKPVLLLARITNYS